MSKNHSGRRDFMLIIYKLHVIGHIEQIKLAQIEFIVEE